MEIRLYGGVSVECSTIAGAGPLVCFFVLCVNYPYGRTHAERKGTVIKLYKFTNLQIYKFTYVEQRSKFVRFLGFGFKGLDSWEVQHFLFASEHIMRPAGDVQPNSIRQCQVSITDPMLTMIHFAPNERLNTQDPNYKRHSSLFSFIHYFIWRINSN